MCFPGTVTDYKSLATTLAELQAEVVSSAWLVQTRLIVMRRRLKDGLGFPPTKIATLYASSAYVVAVVLVAVLMFGFVVTLEVEVEEVLLLLLLLLLLVVVGGGGGGAAAAAAAAAAGARAGAGGAGGGSGSGGSSEGGSGGGGGLNHESSYPSCWRGVTAPRHKHPWTRPGACWTRATVPASKLQE